MQNVFKYCDLHSNKEVMQSIYSTFNSHLIMSLHMEVTCVEITIKYLFINTGKGIILCIQSNIVEEFMLKLVLRVSLNSSISLKYIKILYNI